MTNFLAQGRFPIHSVQQTIVMQCFKISQIHCIDFTVVQHSPVYAALNIDIITQYGGIRPADETHWGKNNLSFFPDAGDDCVS